MKRLDCLCVNSFGLKCVDQTESPRASIHSSQWFETTQANFSLVITKTSFEVCTKVHDIGGSFDVWFLT